MVDHGKYIESAVRLYETVLLMSHKDLLLTHSFGVLIGEAKDILDEKNKNNIVFVFNFYAGDNIIFRVLRKWRKI